MSSSEWREVKLGDVVDTISNRHKFDKDEIVLINTSDVLEGKVLNHEYVKNVNLKGQFKKSFQKNDILYSEIRPQNKRFAYIDFQSDDYVASTKLMVLRKKNETITTSFLYQILKSDDLINELQVIAESRSGTFPQITYNELSRMKIKLPPLDEQKAIAHILSTLDDKIEVNNQINKTLENMAQAYFDDMFPNVAAGDTTIGEYITPKRGKNLLSKDAISGEVPVIAGGLSPATYHNVSNTQSPVITISASGANAGFVNLWTVPVWSSDSSFIDYGMTKDVYFWYVMLKKRQKEIYDSQTGSAQPHIYPKHITIMPTIKLNVDEINLYTKRVTPLFKKIANNLYEISKLQLIRDTLLPKLMSGEIRVPLDEEGDVS